MTPFQIGALVFLVVVFVGSFSLGRYFRWRDDRRDAAAYKEPIQVRPIRPVQMQDIDRGNNYVYSSQDEDQLMEFMQRYYAEIDRLIAGYHTRAIIEGEDFAQKWLREQTGRE